MKKKEHMVLTKQPLAGGSLANFIHLIKKNGIHAKYLPRALYIIFMTFFTLPLRIFEKKHFEKKVMKTEIRKDPIFIIGHWRSGTTYLHNIMGHDKNLGYVSTFQTMVPGVFLGGEKIFKPIMGKHLPKTRPMDNVAMAPDFPYEEEYAIANLSPYSFYHGWYFPKRMREYYKKFVLFEDVSEGIIKKWKETYLYLIKKTTLKWGGKQLVLKNPPNTGRIKLLLEIFPNAKFIHIYRNPYEVYLSTLKLYEKVIAIYTLQEITKEEMEDCILEFYPRMLKKFFEEKKLIPKGNLAEVRYEDFIKNPLEELERIYDELSLPGFQESKEVFKKYIQSQSNYEPSTYVIDENVKEKVETLWKIGFKEWGYAPEILNQRNIVER